MYRHSRAQPGHCHSHQQVYPQQAYSQQAYPCRENVSQFGYIPDVVMNNRCHNRDLEQNLSVCCSFHDTLPYDDSMVNGDVQKVCKKINTCMMGVLNLFLLTVYILFVLFILSLAIAP